MHGNGSGGVHTSIYFCSKLKLGVVITVVPINCPTINLFVNNMVDCDRVVVLSCSEYVVDCGFESTFVYQPVRSFVHEESYCIVPSSVTHLCKCCTTLS